MGDRAAQLLRQDEGLAIGVEDLGEPLGAAFIGITVLDERIRTDGTSLAVIAVAVFVMVVTTIRLSRTQASTRIETETGDVASAPNAPDR